MLDLNKEEAATPEKTIAQNDQEQTDVPEIEYPTPFKLALIVLIICVAGFLCGLDQTILAAAVPKITNDFQALGDIACLTSATLQLVYGRLYSLFSIKLVYIGALFVFGVGSLLCTLAQNSITLVVSRAISGCGAAGIFSGNVLVLAASCPLEKRPGLSGLIFSSVGLASVAGPFIGGALTDGVTWRWCFGVNLPLVALIITGVCFFVRISVNEGTKQLNWGEKAKRFDIPGTLILSASLVSFILALQLGGSKYPWGSARVIILFVISGLVFCGFVALQVFVPTQRSFPVSIIRNRNVLLATFVNGFISSGLFVQITYLPVWFQAVKNASALRSGVMICPMIIAFVVMCAVSGGVTQRIGYYNPAMIFGAVFSAIGGGLLSTFNVNTASSKWVGYQILYGLGAGAGVPPCVLVIQTVLSTEDIPLGVSLTNLFQMLWSSIAVATAQTIFGNELAKGIAAVIPGFDVRGLSYTGASHLAIIYSPSQLENVVPIYSTAIGKTFLITASLGCVGLFCALGLQWKSMKKTVAEGEVSAN
ncbi:MFS general substrate transporter [Glarea lozoyensis ATCC 20868]|uniref:MFS general substrate transporter n=1 Tax=Glarea lozoyensis (strain ATCC 20868 / MF5171) TaxID=1116229 RepID=S3D0U6_GLAL2|nr:MFS general substrate transporter [Glarea lozoyensis ATCC 20868]EPE30769.1 MFS general substrate transporter [Glarea lozoyensis ATCC 20868]